MHRLVLTSLLLATAAPAQAQEKAEQPAAKGQGYREQMKAEVEAAWARPPVEEASAVSHGAVTVAGQSIAYTATAGTLTIRDDEGKPTS